MGNLETTGRAPFMKLLDASSSSVGSKILIALTGLALAVFLIGHLAGNLLFFAGPDAFNHYSHNLVSNPLVYVAEAGLVAVFLLHIVKTVAGVVANRRARPERLREDGMGQDEERHEPQEPARPPP